MLFLFVVDVAALTMTGLRTGVGAIEEGIHPLTLAETRAAGRWSFYNKMKFIGYQSHMKQNRARDSLVNN